MVPYFQLKFQNLKPQSQQIDLQVYLKYNKSLMKLQKVFWVKFGT